VTEFAAIESRVGDYYAGRLHEHGATHRGVDWPTEESQQARFRELLRVADRGPRSYELIDWGCGYGALLDWLGRGSDEVSYTGFDIAAEMVAEAQRRHEGDRHARFVTDQAQLRDADYVVASGIFNVKAGAPEAQWREYLAATVRQMWTKCRRGMAFNALTSYAATDHMESRLHYADPLALFDMCKRDLSRSVALLHDYGLYEFTVLVRRENG